MDLNIVLYKSSQSLTTLLHTFYCNHSLLQLRFQNASQTKQKGKTAKSTVHSTTHPKCDFVFLPLTIFKKAIYIIENTNKAIFIFYWNMHLQQQTSTTFYTCNSLQRTVCVLLWKDQVLQCNCLFSAVCFGWLHFPRRLGYSLMYWRVWPHINT